MPIFLKIYTFSFLRYVGGWGTPYRIFFLRMQDFYSFPKAGADEALGKLADISRHVLLRRTSDIISKYLPPKTVNVVFCRPSQLQVVYV